MSAQTMKTKTGRGSRGSLPELAGLAIAFMAMSVTSLLAAGGDNDSPYNMPGRGGGPTSESHGGGSLQTPGTMMVRLGAGSEVTDGSQNVEAAAVTVQNIDQIATVDAGDGSHLYSASETRLYVPVATSIGIEHDGSAARVQGDALVVRSPQQILLTASSLVGSKQAFLLVGQPGADGVSLARVDYLTGLALEDDALDLTDLAARLAARPQLAGKAASIILLNVVDGSPQQPNRFTLEASAGFAIEELPAIRIQLSNL